MNRLPPPIWNLPPIANQNGGNFVSHDVRYGCGPYHPAYAQYRPQYRPQYQTFAPRAPFYPGIMGSNAQDGKPPRSDSSQSTEPTTVVKFSCDVCERFFNTKQILESHLQSHVECDHEGCSFTASRKMVKLHFIQNHAKGRLRIKLDTPEDIEKWREQRRKKYPTPANVEKKLAEEKARCENGQVAQTQNYRYRGNKQRNKSHCNRQQQRQFPPPNQADNQNACKMKTKKMDPLSMILGDTRSTSEESSDTSSLVQPSVTTNTSALQALSASYGGGSSSDESDAADQEMNNNDKVVTSAEKIASAQSLSVKTKTQQIPSPARNNRKRRQEFTKNMTQQCKSKITLLEKLLAPQIRHENNTILQCVRYIVKKNYLGVMQEQNKLCQ